MPSLAQCGLASCTKSTNQSNSTVSSFLTKTSSQPIPPSSLQRGITVSVSANPILPTPARRIPVARAIGHRVFRRALVLALFFARLAGAQIDTSSIAPHRYLVLYRNATIPGDAESRVASAGAHLTRRNEHFGIAAVESTIHEDDASTLRRLAAQPNVDFVFHDRIVSAQRLRLQSITPP